MKPANKVAQAMAESVEGRGVTKGNAELQNTARTQSRKDVSHAQQRIREAVNRNKKEKLTALLHHVAVDFLRAAFLGLKKRAAAGIDAVTWEQYAEGLEEKLQALHARLHAEPIERFPPAGRIFRRRMGSHGRSASQRWKTRSSRLRWS